MFPPSLGTITPPAWVLLPPKLDTTTPPACVLPLFQVQYYYPLSSLEFHTGLELISWLIMKLVTRKNCCILSRRQRGVDHALSLSICFTEPGLFYILLSVLDWFRGWCYCTTLSRCYPPRYCDLLEEELVVDDGIKTLYLHLCATCLVRSVAHFDGIYFISSFYCVYRQSHTFKIIYYLCSSKPIAVKVGLLFEYVLIGCTATESKCSRIT